MIDNNSINYSCQIITSITRDVAWECCRLHLSGCLSVMLIMLQVLKALKGFTQKVHSGMQNLQEKCVHQGHRVKVKVTGSKNFLIGIACQLVSGKVVHCHRYVRVGGSRSAFD